MRLVGRSNTFSLLPKASCAMRYYISWTVNGTNNMSLFMAYHVLNSYKPAIPKQNLGINLILTVNCECRTTRNLQCCPSDLSFYFKPLTPEDSDTLDSFFSSCEVELASTNVTSEPIADFIFGWLFVVVDWRPVGRRCVFFSRAAWNIATS